MIRPAKPQFWIQRKATYRSHRWPLRHGGLLVWVIPALAAIAVATLWWIRPPEGQSAPPGKIAQTAPKPAAPQIPPTVTAKGVNTQPNADQPLATAPRGVATNITNPRTSPAETQQAVIGEWVGFYQGQRRLTVRKGGKATMVVEPEGLGAMLLAAKLTFEVHWAIKGDQLEFETVGGDPLDKVQVVVKMYGKRRSHKILDLQSDKIVLLDEDGVTEYIWSRAPAAASDTEPPAALD